MSDLGEPTFSISKGINEIEDGIEEIEHDAGIDSEDDEPTDDEPTDDEPADDEPADDEQDSEEELDMKVSDTESVDSNTGSVSASDNLDVFDSDEDEEEDEDYLQKFEKDMQTNVLQSFHPETNNHNYDEVKKLSKVTRDENGMVVDPLHQTLPFLTKYERTRILGQRASQINSGAKPFIPVKADVLDGYLIAEEELNLKKIPFIIKRPMPNGGFEYWRVSDLELL